MASGNHNVQQNDYSCSEGEPIIITEQEHSKARNVFSASDYHPFIPSEPSEEAMSKAVLRERARAVVIGTAPYKGDLYRALGETSGGNGAIIVRFGVGHDGVDKSLARQNGIIICNTPGVLDISVAEHTIWLIGSITRNIARLDTQFRSGIFVGETGRELCGKRLGILGFGRIGRRVAAAAHFGFGMRVWAAGASSAGQLEALEKRSLQEIKDNAGVERYTQDTNELFRECDYVSVHLPARASTRNFVNAIRLELMKSTAILINTARGSIVDESALYDALSAGRIGGAALDVFEHEPYQPVSPGKDLRHLPNVVITPHVGSNTREANQRIAEACLANVSHFFTGNFASLTALNLH